MKVRLIALTQPEPGVFSDGEGTCEDLTTYITRVSNPENQANKETYPKLIAHLLHNKHWSPFDMTNMVIEVITSKAIGIQVLRHHSIHPQEFSQRYAEVENIEYIEFRNQAKTNRQSSTDVVGGVNQFGTYLIDTEIATLQQAEWITEVAKLIPHVLDLYSRGVKMGIAKECARMILPMATSTTMYLNGTVRSWIHYLQQRYSKHAQKEHYQIADQVRDIFKLKFPNIFKALEIEEALDKKD